MYLPEARDQSTLMASVISGRDSKDLLTKDCFLEMNAKIKKMYHPKFEKCFKVTPKESAFSYLKVEYKSDLNGVKVFQKIYSGGNILRENMHPCMVNEIDYSIEHLQKLCFDEWFIYKFFEFPYTDLRTLTKKRKKPGQSGPIFSTRDLKLLLKEQSEALAYLHKKGKFHGSLKPSDIAITRQGKSKLWATSTIDTSKKYITKQKNILMNKGKLYQSPLIFDNLMKKNTIFKVNPAKEDSFSLGLILLEAGTGLSCQDLYKNQKNFNSNHLDFMIKNFEMYHSSGPDLIQEIKELCAVNEHFRKQVNSVAFEQVSKPLEPNTNQNSILQEKPTSVGFFFSDKEATNISESPKQSFFQSDEFFLRKNKIHSPGPLNIKKQDGNFNKLQKTYNRNFTPTRNKNAFGSFGIPNEYLETTSTNRNNTRFQKQKYQYQPNPKKYIEPIYENQPYYPRNPRKYNQIPLVSKSAPKHKSGSKLSHGFNFSGNSNNFQTFGHMTSIQDMGKEKKELSSKHSSQYSDRFSFQKDNFRYKQNLSPQNNIKIYSANGNRGPSLRFQKREQIELRPETLFNKNSNKQNIKYNTEVTSNLKKYQNKNQPQYLTSVQKKFGQPTNVKKLKYIVPFDNRRVINATQPIQKRYKSANIEKNNPKRTLYINHNFKRNINQHSKINNSISNNSQNVSVSKTSSSNVDTFPVMQIGVQTAQSPIAMDRDASLKPKPRVSPLQINKNTLLSQTPLLSPGSRKNKEEIEQYDIDAEDFLAQHKDNPNFYSGVNSKFNLLSQNFDGDYATNNKTASKDNSFQIDANAFLKGSPKDFDENFKVDADELFSQRLNNSGEINAKQFNFEEENEWFEGRFRKITDNSGSQDSYYKIKGNPSFTLI